MKKFLLIFLLSTSYGFAQSNGITYQAVIFNPKGEELPGANNPYSPITDQQVCIQFGIVDVNGVLEYQESVQVMTDGFGMVNLLIGSYLQTNGYATGFSNVNWGPEAKFLRVDINIKGECVDFEELSNQPFTYVPFAYYSPASDIPGPQGTPGFNGENGQDGSDGLSAYDTWVSLGNAGSEQDFIDSLTGPQGIQGETGQSVTTSSSGTNYLQLGLSSFSELSTESMELFEAINHCLNKTEGGFNDWRIPSFDEYLLLRNFLTPPTSEQTLHFIWTRKGDGNYTRYLILEEDRLKRGVGTVGLSDSSSFGSSPPEAKFYARCVR
jgi:hypothetical protein